MDLSIIIITHNSSTPVERCLASIDRHRPSCSYETIVVDNASSDGTVEMISSRFDHVRVIANSDNRGYSRGVNQGMRASSGSLSLILNPDIEVTEGSIDSLVAFMSAHPKAGMAGSRLQYPDGRLQYSCRSFYTVTALLLRRTFLGRLFPRARALRHHLLSDYDHMEDRQVDWLIGACIMVRRDALDKVGMMDERFFLYFEDTDWCFRMHQHGWEVWYVPGSVMTHSYERSSARSLFRKPFLFHLLSLLRYYEKWAKLFNLFRRYRGALKSLVFVTTDLLAINAAFFAAYYLRGALQPLFVNSLYPLDWYAVFIVFYNLIFFITFLFGGLYSIRRETRPAKELFGVIKAVLTTFAILLGATYLTRIRIYSRAVLAGQAFFSIVAVTGARRLIRVIHAQLVRGSFDLKRVVLVGREDEAAMLKEAIMADPAVGMDVVGRAGEGDDVLGPAERLGEIVRRFSIQEIIVLPSCLENGSAPGIVVSAATGMTGIKIVTPAARFMGQDVRVENVGRFHMFSIERGAQHLLLRFMSRIFDLAAGVVMLPLSALLHIIVRPVAAMSGGISWSSEERVAAGGVAVSNPRGVLKDGSEVSDLLKPRIWAGLLAGRTALVGVPTAPAGIRPPEGQTAVSRPGITGRWRIVEYEDWMTAVEDEILDERSRSMTGYLEILFSSLAPILSGAYPRWFFSKER